MVVETPTEIFLETKESGRKEVEVHVIEVPTEIIIEKQVTQIVEVPSPQFQIV